MIGRIFTGLILQLMTILLWGVTGFALYDVNKSQGWEAVLFGLLGIIGIVAILALAYLMAIVTEGEKKDEKANT